MEQVGLTGMLALPMWYWLMIVVLVGVVIVGIVMRKR